MIRTGLNKKPYLLDMSTIITLIIILSIINTSNGINVHNIFNEKTRDNVMLRFFKSRLIELLSISKIGSFATSLASNQKEPVKGVSLTNQLCETRATSDHIMSDETPFSPFVINVNKCGGIWNFLDDTHARVYVPNKLKKINAKII